MIAPMKKVSIVCMREDREKLLIALQHSALIMITASDTGVAGSDRESSEHQRRIDQLIKELQKYSEKKGIFSSLPEIEKKDFDNVSEGTLSICKSIEDAIAKRDELLAEKISIENDLNLISQWQELDIDTKDLTGTVTTEIITGRLPAAKLRLLEEFAESGDFAAQKVSENEKSVQVLVIYLKEHAQEVRSALIECDLEEVKLPARSGLLKDHLARLTQRLDELNGEAEKLNESLKKLAEKSKTDVETLFEQYRASSDRAELRLEETIETVFVEGWVRENCCEKLKAVIADAITVFDMEFRDPLEDEEVPASLTNNKVVSQFEGITEMFNPPKYGDYDPNAVMAPWYWIIFGMMMGDVGYGAMMVVLISLAKKLMKPKGGTAKIMNVLLYSSITTILFGILFGSYFGEELLPPLIGFTSMSDPIKMLILTLIVGVLHIFTGMITKMVLNIKSGHPLDAVFDQLSWLMILSGIGMIFIPPLSNIGPWLSLLGAAIVLLTAGRSKKGLFGKLAGGVGGLYNITSYLSDILSYSRILALGLATGVVGYVMNMLAAMVQNGVIGFIFSLLIYIVGHVFNLAISLLSAYVHSCRLQYIEFYSKFYEGGGTVFRPFSIRTNYINIKKD